jgi:hypothetical protein
MQRLKKLIFINGAFCLGTYQIFLYVNGLDLFLLNDREIVIMSGSFDDNN